MPKTPAIVASLLMSLIAAWAFLPAGAAAQEATPPPVEETDAVRTETRLFIPFVGGEVAAGLDVAREATGFCAIESLAAVGRPDAWTCTEAETNDLLDPCFEDPIPAAEGPARLACAADPFANEVVLFTSTEPLERRKQPDAVVAVDPSDGGTTDAASQAILASEEFSPVLDVAPLDLPWAVELANGARCTVSTGAAIVIAGERANYRCDDGGLVIGEVDRSMPRWAVSYLADGAFASELIEVEVAWT